MKYLKLAALVVLFSWAGVANACKCAEQYDKIENIRSLERYEFIALVKIGKLDTTAFGYGQGDMRVWHFEIIEKFIGKDYTTVWDQPFPTSCNIGIQTGDEWILFALKENNGIKIVACDRNTPYKRINEAAHWRSPFGTSMLARLQSLYPPLKATLPPPPRKSKQAVHVDDIVSGPGRRDYLFRYNA